MNVERAIFVEEKKPFLIVLLFLIMFKSNVSLIFRSAKAHICVFHFQRAQKIRIMRITVEVKE